MRCLGVVLPHLPVVNEKFALFVSYDEKFALSVSYDLIKTDQH